MKTVDRCPDGSEGFGEGCTTQPANWPGSTPEPEVQKRFEPKVAENPGPIVQQGIENGLRFDPLSHEITGPAEAVQPETITTRTAPDGTPQTRTEQVTNHITYAGDTMTWTSTTVINDYDGTQTVKDDTPKDDRSECEKNPDTLGCSKMDTPEVEDLQTKELRVSYAEDGGFATSGQCPAPKQVTAMGQTFEVSYQPLCDFMGWMRGIVLAVAGLAAALIFVNGFKG